MTNAAVGFSSVAPVRRLFFAAFVWLGLAVLALAVGASTGLFPLALLGAVLLRGGFGAYLYFTARSARRDPARPLAVARVAVVLVPPLILAGAILASMGPWTGFESPLYTREPTVFVPEQRIAEAVLLRSSTAGPAERILGASPYDFEVIPMLGLLVAFLVGLTVAFARRRQRTAAPAPAVTQGGA